VRLGALVVAAALVAGCGGESSSSTDDDDGSEAAVERTVQEFFLAFAERDGERACRVVTKQAAEEIAARAGQASCPEGVEANAAKLLDGQRDALRNLELLSVEVDGDTAEVVTGPEDETFARSSGAPVGLTRVGDRWVISDFPEVSQQASGGRGTALDCRTGALASYEDGKAAPFWEHNSRADYIAYIKRVCDRLAAEVDDLASPEGRRQGERIANQVLRSMVRSGRIKVQ